eukprot:6466085-Amphidinium_carterae.1
MAAPICPPNPIPTELETDVGKLDSDLRALFGSLSIPFHVQAAFARSGFSTIADLADRWPSKSDARKSGPDDLGFKDGSNGHTAATSLVTAVRLGQAIETAQERVKQRQQLVSSTEDTNAKYILTSAVRSSMEKLYQRKYHAEPPLESQGSDAFLGKLYKDVAKGSVSFYPLNKVQPYLADVDPVPRVSKRKRSDESEHEYEEDPPASWEAWRQRLLVWRTSLLMAVVGHPHHTHLQIEMADLEKFYQFLDGPEIGRRSPPPSLNVMMRAERAAWRRISILLHEGQSLDQAITQVRTDTLFWVREVYEHLRAQPSSPFQPGKRPRAPTPPAMIPRKGNSKGKSKQKQSYDLSKWGSHDSSGLEICRNFHFGICKVPADKCRRSHKCPYLKPDGTTCSGNHAASSCPLTPA